MSAPFWTGQLRLVGTVRQGEPVQIAATNRSAEGEPDLKVVELPWGEFEKLLTWAGDGPIEGLPLELYETETRGVRVVLHERD